MKFVYLRLERGGWEGLYADSKLITQGETINVATLLEELGHEVIYVERDGKFLEEHGGRFPETISAVKRDLEDRRRVLTRRAQHLEDEARLIEVEASARLTAKHDELAQIAAELADLDKKLSEVGGIKGTKG